ncbi:LOW QUALITY PROTEIN: beta-defensin 129 [Mesoplodon densirostris]|uniref:LOW QUALITY PROTEIN: beta-defensin 129 n=1 Tax=Mesoplodon densirostris TaxID=48708 RepID=UPI0028DAFFF6|nr:LOW QUALITY PROTEIN: beta-defensin 129 [Mesoplodon densirostris]
MKLLFPIFASLMLQYQVNTEYFGLGRCVMGFGRCKDHCAMDEKEVDKCKKKKCCIGPKVFRLIKSYIQNEMLHTLEEDSQEVLKSTKNFSVVMQTKNHILALLPKFKSVNPFANINTSVIPNATTVKSATTNPMISGKIIHTATSTKSDTKKRRDSATHSPPPAPPP